MIAIITTMVLLIITVATIIKNLGLLCKAKPFLNAKAMKSLYFSFFHSYLTYGNIAWYSTSMAKLKKIFS